MNYSEYDIITNTQPYYEDLVSYESESELESKENSVNNTGWFVWFISWFRSSI